MLKEVIVDDEDDNYENEFPIENENPYLQENSFGRRMSKSSMKKLRSSNATEVNADTPAFKFDVKSGTTHSLRNAKKGSSRRMLKVRTNSSKIVLSGKHAPP